MESIWVDSVDYLSRRPLILRLIAMSWSSLSLRNRGWLKTLLEWSARDLWKPYMFNCLIKLLILLCRKYLGSTICWNLFTSLITNSDPDGAQKAILLNYSFFRISNVLAMKPATSLVYCYSISREDIFDLQ